MRSDKKWFLCLALWGSSESFGLERSCSQDIHFITDFALRVQNRNQGDWGDSDVEIVFEDLTRFVGSLGIEQSLANDVSLALSKGIRVTPSQEKFIRGVSHFLSGLSPAAKDEVHLPRAQEILQEALLKLQMGQVPQAIYLFSN